MEDGNKQKIKKRSKSLIKTNNKLDSASKIVNERYKLVSAESKLDNVESKVTGGESIIVEAIVPVEEKSIKKKTRNSSLPNKVKSMIVNDNGIKKVVNDLKDIFWFPHVKNSFSKENCISLSIIEDQKSILQTCKIMSLSNVRCLTDAFFITLQDSVGVNKMLTDLYCNGCEQLTDCASYFISTLFENLQNICLDSCSKITERSVLALYEKCKKISNVSMKQTDVKLLPGKILNSLIKFQFDDCPIEKELTTFAKKDELLSHYYKFVIMTEWGSKNYQSIFNDKYNKNENKIIFNTILINDNILNFFECDYELAHLFATPGTVFISLSDKSECTEKAISLALTAGKGSPCILCDQSDNVQFTNLLQSFASPGSFYNGTNFAGQKFCSNLRNMLFLLSRPNIIMKATLEKLKDFKNDIYKNAINFLETYFPELKLVPDNSFNDFITGLKSSKKFIEIQENFCLIEYLVRQGCFFQFDDQDTKLICAAETFVTFLNDSLNEKNEDAFGTLIPWLLKDATVLKMTSATKTFSRFVESPEMTEQLFKIFTENSFLTKIFQPWISDVCTLPVFLVLSGLPSDPPTDPSTLWNNFCNNDEQEIVTYFSFAIQPPSVFMQKIIASCLRLGRPTIIWKKGLIFHYGCSEIFIKLVKLKSNIKLLGVTLCDKKNRTLDGCEKSAYKNEKCPDITKLQLAVRILSIQEKKQIAAWEGRNSKKGFEEILRSTFRLLRQCVIVAILECELAATEEIRCPKCAVEKNEHHFKLEFSHQAKFQCTSKIYTLKDFGLNVQYCQLEKHSKSEESLKMNSDRCTMCSVSLENLNRMWCSQCARCSKCISFLTKQGLHLNASTTRPIGHCGSTFEVFSMDRPIPFMVALDLTIPSVFHIYPKNKPDKVSLCLMDGRDFKNDLSKLSKDNSGDKVVITSQIVDDTIVVTLESTLLQYKMKISEANATFYLVFYELNSSVVVQSNRQMNPIITELSPGMRLEAKDQKTPTHICIATVADIDVNGNVMIHFDGWGKTYDYFAPMTNEDLHPIGYCQHVSHPLQMPRGEEPDEYRISADFSWSDYETRPWENYLIRNSYQAVPYQFFNTSQTKGSPEIKIDLSQNSKVLRRKFEVGMKLEAKCSHNTIAVATIKEVKNGSLILFFGGSNDTNEYSYEFSSVDIHPIGFCQHFGYKLYKSNKFQRQFQWFDYLMETLSKPVPYKCFSTKQTLQSKKHWADSYFNEMENFPTCFNIYNMNMCIFLTTSQFYTTQKIANVILNNFIHDDDYDKNYAFAFGLLPLLKTNDDLIFPRRQLVHRFDVDKQNIIIFVISKESLTPFLKPLDITKPDEILSERYINPCLLPGCVTSMNRVVKKKSNDPVMHSFLHQSQYLLIYSLILLNRAKFQCITTNFSLLFPEIIVDFRLGCENMLRYMLLYLYTLFVFYKSYPDETEDVEKTEKEGTLDKKKGKLKEDKSFGRNNISCLIDLLASKFTVDDMQKLLPRSFVIDKSGDNVEQLVKDYETFSQWNSIVALNAKVPLNSSLVSKICQTCHWLSEISLTNCNLTTFEFDNDTLSQRLLKLNLSYNPLKKIPPFVFRLTELRELHLAACGLQGYLPIGLTALKKLTLLNLDYNFFKQLPEGVVNLPTLQHLSLQAVPYYSFENLPITLNDFTNCCKKFYLPSFQDLSNERISAKVSELAGIKSFATTPIQFEGGMVSLNELIHLEAPRFESTSSTGNSEIGHGFPLVICQLKYLESLDLSSHNISHIPPELNLLENIKKLSCTDCPYLEEVSETTVLGTELRELNLKGCLALKSPPIGIVNKGMKEIFEYLRRKLIRNEDCKRTKVMLVGLGGAGKSTLLKALTYGAIGFQNWWNNVEVTDGIDIKECAWKIKEQTAIFSFWDFAGQSVYYNTHQFFLSNRAIYLLLWNSRLGYEHSGLDFWLSSIACHAPEAPIFVIATFADQIARSSLPKAHMTRSYPQITSFERISSGINEFRDRLIEVALSQMKQMDNKVEKVYLDLETAITEKRSETSIVKFSEVQELARRIGIVRTNEVRAALMFLHELGSVQYFTNEFLRDKVIIDPQWLVNVMTCLVTVKGSVIKDGIFKKKDINEIWSKYDEDLRPWLLKLTEEFDLTFELPIEKIHVVPCLLPEEEPKYDWLKDKKNKEGRMNYKFEYIPAGLFNRIQARLCQFSDGSKVWKTGSFLNKNNHVILLRQTYNNELTVLVNGPRPDNALFLIYEVIENIIHESFRGVQFEIMIPCPECMNAGEDSPHMFSNKTINKAIELKVPMLQCSISFHFCSINLLHSILPPISLIDCEQRLMETMQEMKSLRNTVSKDVCLLICKQNIDQPNQICPIKIYDDLMNSSIQCSVIKPSKQIKVEELALELFNSNVLVVCISNEFCNNKNCTDLFAYVRQSNKPLIVAVVGRGNEWKSTTAGLLVGADLYFDFQKPDLYEIKFKKLCDRINERKKVAKLISESITIPSIFFSYCWMNSHETVKTSQRTNDGGLGEMDPRDICKFLSKNGFECWVDYRNLYTKGQKALFEEIAEGLRNARLIIACVSDEYLLSHNCLREFHFAIGTLKLPSILCVVGRGRNWQESELTLLAYKSPRVDFQSKNDSSLQTLLELVRQHFAKDANQQKDLRSLSVVANEEDNNLEAYKELCELAQRRFLLQMNQIAIKISKKGQYRKPYPRLILLDVIPSESLKTETNNKLSLTDFSPSNICMKFLCEHLRGWHVVGEPIKLSDTNYFTTVNEIINKSACYQMHLLNILQHSTVEVEFLKLPNADKLMNDFKNRSNDNSIESLEESYKFFSNMVRKNDPEMIRGELQRYSMYSRKICWLCSEHGKLTRGVLTDDDADLEDVLLSLDNKSENVSLKPDEEPHSSLQENNMTPVTQNNTDNPLETDPVILKKIKQKSRLCNVM